MREGTGRSWRNTFALNRTAGTSRLRKLIGEPPAQRMQLAYAALALSTLALVAFGLVMVFSATSVRFALAINPSN